MLLMGRHYSLLGELNVSYVNSTAKGLLELVLSFLWTSLHASFLFADFALYLFTIINISHEYNYKLSSVYPSKES